MNASEAVPTRRRLLRPLCRVTALLLALLAPALGAVPVAEAASITCGMTITRSVTLHRDLVGCPDVGLTIAGDDVTLDLHGHVIRGDGRPFADCPGDRPCDAGVVGLPGHHGITVTNGTIRGFDLGVLMLNGERDRVADLTTTDLTSLGIVFRTVTGGEIRRNRMIDPGVAGLVLVESKTIAATGNLISGTSGYAAVFFGSDDGSFQHNRMVHDQHGFNVVDSKRTLVRDNYAEDLEAAVDVGRDATSTRVEHNRLVRVADGVIVGDATGVVVRDNPIVVDRGRFSDAGGFGIILDGATQTTVQRNTVRGAGPGPGIYVVNLDTGSDPRDNVLSSNRVAGSAANGIQVDPGAVHTVLVKNTAGRNGADGILVGAAGTTLTQNRADRNHHLGIDAGEGVVDGGKNRARGNGDPRQCLGVRCR